MGTLSVSKWHVGVRVCVCLCVYRWTHCLLSRVGSLVWQGSDRSRIGWNSSPCALQMLVKWRDGHTHTHATPHDPHTLWAAAHSVHSNTPTTICPLLHLNHTHRSKINQSSIVVLLVTMTQNCQSSSIQTHKHSQYTHAHANLHSQSNASHAQTKTHETNTNGAVRSFILHIHT